MASVIETIAIETSAETCWDALRDFGSLHQRLASGFITDCRLVEPDVREITFSSGAVARERLVGIDDDAMRLAYTVTDSPLGSTHHNASAQVVPDGPGRCTFIWITDVLPDELATTTSTLMASGLQAIKRTVEGGASG